MFAMGQYCVVLTCEGHNICWGQYGVALTGCVIASASGPREA